MFHLALSFSLFPSLSPPSLNFSSIVRTYAGTQRISLRRKARKSCATCRLGVSRWTEISGGDHKGDKDCLFGLARDDELSWDNVFVFCSCGLVFSSVLLGACRASSSSCSSSFISHSDEQPQDSGETKTTNSPDACIFIWLIEGIVFSLREFFIVRDIL